jgi:ATP-dependent DNA helicase RecG
VPAPNDLVSLVDALRRPLLFAARDGFAGIDQVTGLGATLRAGCDRLARAPLPAERVAPVQAWRRALERFEKLPRGEQEIEVARGLRLCLALGGPMQPQPQRKAALPPPSPSPMPSPIPSPSPSPKAAPAAPLSPLAQPVTVLPGIGPTLAQHLHEHDLDTLEDLVWFVPRRFDDLRRVLPLREALQQPAGERVTYAAQVVNVSFSRFGRRFLTVRLRDPDDVGVSLTARWFSVPGGMANRFERDRMVVLSGPLRERDGQREATNPEVISDGAEGGGGGIRPRYPVVEGVPPATLRKATRAAIERTAAHLEDGVPAAIAARLALPRLPEALAALHAPAADLPEAAVVELDEGKSPHHRRLAFDELFFLSLAIGRRRLERHADHAPPCVASASALDELRPVFPFALTGAQERTVAEIAADLARAEPMGRLLQGDVGAGKTAVAFAAAHLALRARRQVAIMAPTEILAEQHLRTLEPWARATGHRIALLTASTPRGVRESTLGMLEAGVLGILVGTHALLAGRVNFADLGLVVIDEQHRFGVAQRARLRGKGESVPHLLVMTATPIPRTLALAAYGDLDVSTLDQLPPGRTPPETRVCTGVAGRKQAYQALRRAVAEGARAFVVCPLVDRSEEPDAPRWANATDTAARLAEELAPARVGLVHGRMPRDERDAAMTALRQGELDVLVATTVIEVGVDVPEARVMLVEDAERFGLAQLHQLRGRVGRGGGTSLCLLCTGGARTSEAVARLAIMAETCDGFRIAEEDLAIRGPGELLGARQAGLPKLRFGDLAAHGELLRVARGEADALLAEDPGLARPEHAATARVLAERIAGPPVYGAEGG